MYNNRVVDHEAVLIRWGTMREYVLAVSLLSLSLHDRLDSVFVDDT